MAQTIRLNPENLKVLRTVDPCLMSYNVEMAEVTGGTFWKSYTPEQVAGIEPFQLPEGKSFYEIRAKLMEKFPPVDLYNPRLRKLAEKFGPVWIRVSGTWATGTYYDFDGKMGGKAPKGYLNALTKEQWIGVLDFVKAMGGKLMISVANCEGLHVSEEPWNPSEAEKIFALSKEYGVPVAAAEFMNEPNVRDHGTAPNYLPEHFARDQDLFIRWVRKNYPETIIVGPCATGSNSMGNTGDGGITSVTKSYTTDQLMENAKEPMDIFSYHYYNGISERLAPMAPSSHWPRSRAMDEDYLGVVANSARAYSKDRDKFVPGSPMWVTESGDAGGGGTTWASSYLDVFRFLNELGSFATITDGVIFHNTLCASDYAFLKSEVFDPRPNYFAALLWNTLMGTTVYDSGEPIRMGAHVYAHSRRDGKEGIAYLIINNSKTDATTVELPVAAERYTLSADHVSSPVMKLNGRDLVLGENDELPDLSPVKEEAGTLILEPATITFLVV